METNIVERKPRKFLPDNFTVQTWDELLPYYELLLQKEISNKEDILQFLDYRSELDAVVEEDYCWRYINKTRDTGNKEYEDRFNYFIKNIESKRLSISNQLDLKIYHSGLLDLLEDGRFLIFKRKIKNNIDLFREENIELLILEEETKNQYYKIAGAMTVNYEGKEITIQQLGAMRSSKDRKQRAEAFRLESERRLEDKAALNKLFNDLRKIRHQIGINAGFDNYRDYKLKRLGRFDYGVKECEQFHDSIEHSLIPVVNELMEYRKKALKVDHLKPYDLDVDLGASQDKPPFEGSEDLVNKTIQCLQQIDPYFSHCIATMKNMEHLDLESRKGKAPGGYNCPLPEIGVPYIFMNAANSPRDLKTMIHEGGHAVHSFLMANLDYNFDKNITSEAAELASMSMELFALDAYQTFYKDPIERKAAIYSFLESSFISIPWIALIDKFQHWIYTHPNHTDEERTAVWKDYSKRFSSSLVDWSDFELYRDNIWQRQLHLFMVPFYYIEYGIARLGSYGMYRNFKKNPKETISDYKNALKIGYTKPLPNIYEAAGIPFNFSPNYIKELAEFMKEQLN